MTDVEESPVMNFRVAMLGGLFLAQLSVPSPAQTVSLPAATASWYVGTPAGNLDEASPGSGSYTVTGHSPGESATATAGAFFGGSWASGSVDSNDSELQNSFVGEVGFWFEIVGPGYATETHTPVSMHIVAEVAAQASGIDTGASAVFEIYSITPVVARADVGFLGEPPIQVVTIDGDYSFQTNSRYNVGLTADGESGPLDGPGPGGYASALADPIFTLDPSLGSAYQLVVSPGVDVSGPLPSVPEPAVAGSMLAGLGAIALLMRRRSRMAPVRGNDALAS